MDAYGYPVYLMISEGQRNDINFAIPVLEHVPLEGNMVLADRGYDSEQLIDYIHERGGESTIPSRKSNKIQRECDWWLYKERHLVEKLFLKLKSVIMHHLSLRKFVVKSVIMKIKSVNSSIQ